MPSWLSEVYRVLNAGEGSVATLVGIIGFVGVIASVITSYIVAGRSVYINSITTQRSLWIEKLRVNIAAYSGQLAAIVFKMLTASFQRGRDTQAGAISVREELEKLNHTAATIQLQLNPWGDIDKNILKIIDSIVVRKDTNIDLIDRADKLLVAHSQWLLKAEWEKVKFEARSPIYRFFHYFSAYCRLCDYKAWVKKEGSIASIVAEFAVERAKPVGG